MLLRGLMAVVGVACVVAAVPYRAPLAQSAPASRVFHVRETMGIRRTEYPVTVTIQLPKGALKETGQARVMTNSAEVPAQFTSRAAWDDGSVQTLDVDLNVSLDAEEDRRYELQYGPSVAAAAKVERGITATEQGDAVVVGNLKFSKSGGALLTSATYGGERIGTGSNGLTLTDTNGRRHDLSAAQGAQLEIVKPGPIVAMLRYSATLPLDEGYAVPIELLLEMPNSKSWLKTTATVTDRQRKLRDAAVERPYAFTGFPVLWDFGTDSGTYGVFRAAADTVTLTQTTNAGGPTGWRVESGPPNQRRALETSAGSRPKLALGWGHLQDAKAAVAFAVSRFGRDPGTWTIALAGSGQATFRFVPSSPATQQQLVVYEHFVSTPVAIGAATNPTAMLNPPQVTVER
jgi:hypothetical protein